MDYQSRINKLNEDVKNIIKQISESTEPAIIETLKNKKSTYESEIRRLTRLKFEEDTQRVHFDDDR